MKADLLAAEFDALNEEMGEVVGAFLGISADSDDQSEIRAAIEIARGAWAKFEAWRRAHAGEAKRPAGTGSVQRSGNGYQWRVSRDGQLLRGKVRPTREEAQAELDRVIADPTFVPAACDGTRLQNGKHHCSRCGQPGHRANRCPAVPEIAPAPAPSAAPMDPVKALLPWSAAPPEAAPAVRPFDLEDLDAWSPPGKDGRQTCMVCNGEGIDRREGGQSFCLHCDGEGYR